MSHDIILSKHRPIYFWVLAMPVTIIHRTKLACTKYANNCLGAPTKLGAASVYLYGRLGTSQMQFFRPSYIILA